MTDLYDDLDAWDDYDDDLIGHDVDERFCHAPGVRGEPLCVDDICRGRDACMYEGLIG
jgi:hypothetical protein